jgi:hypothetical protein
MTAPLVTREEIAEIAAPDYEFHCCMSRAVAQTRETVDALVNTLIAFADLLERNHRCYKGDTGLGYCESCAALDAFGRKEK